MRRIPLLLSATLALALASCSGEAEIDVDTSPDVTTTETVTEEVTVPTPTPVPTATDGTDDGPQATASPDGDVDELAFTDCSTDRYTIGYPSQWNVNEPDEYTSECTIFHPGEIETPDEPRDRDLHWAVTVFVDAVEYDDVKDGGGENEEVSREEITVEGRDAIVSEYRSTGAALVPEGERWYSYTVDLDGEILVAVTYTIGDTDYERDKDILDRMVTEELSISS